MGEESTGVFDALVQFVIEGDSACGCPAATVARWWITLRDDFLDRMGIDNSGELFVEASVEIGQSLMVQTHQSQDGRVQVAKMARVLNGRFAKFIGSSIAGASSDPCTG